MEDAKLDTNVCAYVATGVWHHWLITQDRGFVEHLWPTVRRAIDWVLSLQTERGEIVWAREVDERPWAYALLTGSSSIYHALDCALALAEVVGAERPRWELALAALGRVIRTLPDAFEPKERWAMDWYYPVLCNVLEGDRRRAAAGQPLGHLRDARARRPLRERRAVGHRRRDGRVRHRPCCRRGQGQGHRAAQLDEGPSPRRRLVLDRASCTRRAVHFPAGERTAYTAAAVILAADAISGTSAASDIFIPATLPLTAVPRRGRDERLRTAFSRTSGSAVSATGVREKRCGAGSGASRSTDTSTNRPLSSAGR